MTALERANTKLAEAAAELSGEMARCIGVAKAAIGSGDIAACVAQLTAVEALAARLRAILGVTIGVTPEHLQQVDERVGEARVMRQLLEGFAERHATPTEAGN